MPAHATSLAVLARLGSGVGIDQLVFVGRLAAAAPEAVADLASFLTRTAGGTS